mmetsp:Transcript_23990/g.67196  ORF Transcript_23990/g.67196 Transcript_23990/m.67196 type:complete len:236 (-) Transcript_23990:1850-2557(-)
MLQLRDQHLGGVDARHLHVARPGVTNVPVTHHPHQAQALGRAHAHNGVVTLRPGKGLVEILLEVLPGAGLRKGRVVVCLPARDPRQFVHARHIRIPRAKQKQVHADLVLRAFLPQPAQRRALRLEEYPLLLLRYPARWHPVFQGRRSVVQQAPLHDVDLAPRRPQQHGRRLHGSPHGGLRGLRPAKHGRKRLQQCVDGVVALPCGHQQRLLPRHGEEQRPDVRHYQHLRTAVVLV